MTFTLFQPFPLRDISNGRSGCSADTLLVDPWPDPAVAFFDNTCEAGMMRGTAENRVLEWMSTVAVLPARHAEPAGIILKIKMKFWFYRA